VGTAYSGISMHILQIRRHCSPLDGHTNQLRNKTGRSSIKLASLYSNERLSLDRRSAYFPTVAASVLALREQISSLDNS